MRRLIRLSLTAAAAGLAAVAVGSPVSASGPAVHYLGTVKASHGARPTSNKNLYYHGGTADGAAGTIGVETAPKVYVVFWGSQWTNNDPSGEANLVTGMLSNVGGSNWNNIDTQYCQGEAAGSYSCNGGTPTGNQKGMLAGSWYDGGTAAPSKPSQSQLASEAVNAAAHFGNVTAQSNASTQYVIATATGNSASGFGTQYCAWHSSTSSSYGDIAYTNLPYITDAGSSCGANFNGLGPDAGITIVEGHEFAETSTDQFPSTGWLDGGGSENGDKCAWNSATQNVNLNGSTYPMQPLWDNAKSACALSGP